MIYRHVRCVELVTRDRGPGNPISHHATLEVEGVRVTFRVDPSQYDELTRAFAADADFVLSVGIEVEP